MLDFLSNVFPVDFYIYFETLKYKEYLPNNKSEIKKYQRRSAKERFIKKRLVKMRKYKLSIRERRAWKAAFNVERCCLLNSEEIKFLDSCKEVKIFKQTSLKHLPRFIEETAQVEVLGAIKATPVLKLINYLLTMMTK